MATVKPAVMKYIYGSCSGPADLRKDASRLQRPNAQPNVIKKNRLLIESNRVHSLSQIPNVFMIRLNIMALILVYGCKVKQSCRAICLDRLNGLGSPLYMVTHWRGGAFTKNRQGSSRKAWGQSSIDSPRWLPTKTRSVISICPSPFVSLYSSAAAS